MSPNTEEILKADPEIANHGHGTLDRGESVLDRHDDPFAPRQGKTLVWKDVNMTLVSVNK
jgi:hypothetical protein